ncbi:unnamed protein product [Thelazia callipaeda]|uniref:DUF3786 domain-containing protein n=1 Tax=Thelazia callipaeda TaxID=103827 RepID=A0A0N5CT00_THECL|nr:unnamed protein product [Thelazia callipaeda]
MLKKYCFIPYNVILRFDHSYEMESVLPSVDRELGNVEVRQNDIHVAVEITRSALPAIEYYPLSDVILDYLPYLCAINKASRAKILSSRRAVHYFDEYHGSMKIDPTGTMKIALLDYTLLN